MIAKSAAVTGVSCRGLTACLPSRPAAAFKSSRRQVLVRFRDDKEMQDLQTHEKADTKVSLEEIKEVGRHNACSDAQDASANIEQPLLKMHGAEDAYAPAQVDKALCHWHTWLLNSSAAANIDIPFPYC